MKISKFQDKSLIDLSTLEGLEDVEWLDVRGTNVSDLSPLTKSKKLMALSIDDTKVTDLSPISKLPKLEYLTFSNTQVIDLNPLLGLRLSHVKLKGTPLSYDWEIRYDDRFRPSLKVSSFLEGHVVRHEVDGVAKSMQEAMPLIARSSFRGGEYDVMKEAYIKAHEEALKCSGYTVKTVEAFGEKYVVTFTCESIREVRFFDGEWLRAAEWMHTELGEEIRKQLKL